MNNSDSSCKCGPCGASFILRLTLAVVLFPHGAQKLLGWFGGYGFTASRHFLESSFHIPAFLAVIVILVEFFGPILLLLGCWTRLVALILGVHMLVAMYMGHIQNGFFMNWTGAQKGEGFEYHLLYIGIAIALILLGGQRFSIDHCRCCKKEEKPAPAAPAS